MTISAEATPTDTGYHTPELNLVTGGLTAVATTETVGTYLTPEQQEIVRLRKQLGSLQEINQALTNELFGTQTALEETARVGEIEKNLRVYYEFLAKHDEKTGLYNWRGLCERYETMVTEGRLAGVVYLDVTNLKRVNKTDKYQHIGGDYAIDGYSRATLGAVRADQDVVARIGGDEIVVLIEKPKGLEEANTKRLMMAICQRFDCNTRQFLKSNIELDYTDLAYGISLFDDNASLESLILKAKSEAEKLKEWQHKEKGEYRAQEQFQLSPFQQIETTGYIYNC